MSASDQPRKPRSPARAKRVDFRRVSKFPRVQVRRLEHAHDSFCRSASIRLTSELGSELQLRVVSTDQLPYSIILDEEIPQQSLGAVLRLQPFNTQVALFMELDLAQQLVTRLLGGEVGAQPNEELTEIETAIARNIITNMVEVLSGSWGELNNVSLSLAALETSSVDVQIASPSEPTLLLSIEAEIEGLKSLIRMVLPFAAVRQVIQQAGAEGHEADPGIAAAVRRNLGMMPMEMLAEVGSVQVSLRSALALEPGDTVPLKALSNDGIFLRLAGGGPSYRAVAALRGSTRVVQVLEPAPMPLEGSAAAAHAVSQLIQTRAGSEEDPRQLRSVPVRLSAELGRTHATLEEALALPTGAILELDRSPEDPVDLYLNGLRYGSGELMQSGDEWAFRLLSRYQSPYMERMLAEQEAKRQSYEASLDLSGYDEEDEADGRPDAPDEPLVRGETESDQVPAQDARLASSESGETEDVADPATAPDDSAEDAAAGAAGPGADAAPPEGVSDDAADDAAAGAAGEAADESDNPGDPGQG